MGTSIDEWARYVETLPYFERRLEIRRRIRPRWNSFLYKYKAIDPNREESKDRIRDMLVRSRLWLSSPTDFNDPFDMSAKLVAKGTGRERRERYKAWAKEAGVNYKERERQANEFAKKSVEELEKELSTAYRRNLENVGVFSFAGDPRNILMWSHYARDHAGICIQFERARDFPTLIRALPVSYSAEYPEANWLKDFSDSLGKILLRKHDGWDYEDEHRIVLLGHAHKYLPIKPQAIVRIIIGCRTPKASIELVKGLLEERRKAKMPLIQLYLAQQHKSRYSLSIVRDKVASQQPNMARKRASEVAIQVK